jgi:hypothetical protein
MKSISFLLIATLSMLSLTFCSNSTGPEENTEENAQDNPNTQLPSAFGKFVDEVNIYIDGSYVVLETKGVPNHTSPYWGLGHSLYEPPHSGMVVNPNRIAEQNLVFRIPLNPKAASTISATPLGPIGISVNGVALYNQYAGPNQPLEREIATFDRYHGHPQQTGQYHYHIEPLRLTNDDNSLVGFLLDGFPVYGRKDIDGAHPTNLDDANGHFGATIDYPNGIYHYHITPSEPYISGGFKGTAGTVSR